ncbi:hypothetical protein FACS189449_04100 [Alphaproteobacteria bacterium]|nr:hypothetical protein FACS189449_04100 [Alphaproteobacteria bacterium]
MKKISHYAVISITIACSLLFFRDSRGDDISFINSDETLYEKNNIICKGNVIVVYCGRIISADKISFDKEKEIVTAVGNIILRDERGNLYFMDSLWVHRDFSSGNAQNVKIIMPDKSRLAATDCAINECKLELNNVIYTPCYECCGSELTWQLKSEHVTYDPDEYIEYSNANFELFGQTIFYSPYLSQPSPKIKRKSGFLAPKFTTASKSGFSIRPQYLLSISESQELIIKPMITSKIGCVAWAYYRYRFKNGEFSVDASITGTQSVKNHDANNKIDQRSMERIKKIESSGYRGHLFSKMNYEIDNVWRCGFDINLASDYYYLKRFSFFDKDRTLESNARIEGFDGRNYTLLKTIMFQGDPNATDNAARVLPIMEHKFSKTLFGGTFSFDAMFLNLYFRNARSVKKIITNVSWEKNFLLAYGQIIDLKGITSFKAINVSEPSTSKSDDDSAIRITPQVSIIWKWPLIISSSFAETIVTPMIGAIFADNKKYDDLFEDPLGEINDINLMDGSRSISPYNVDNGSRICYGMKFSAYKDGNALGYITIGRSTELTKVPEKIEASGLKHKNSNIVYSGEVFISNEISVTANGSYSTRDRKLLKFESGVKFSNKYVDLDIVAFKGKQSSQSIFKPKELNDETADKRIERYKGIMLDAIWKVNSKLKLKTGVVLGHKKSDGESIEREKVKLVKHNVGFEYKNECIELEVGTERTNYSGGDLRPETSFQFVVHFKNLGA